MNTYRVESRKTIRPANSYATSQFGCPLLYPNTACGRNRLADALRRRLFRQNGNFMVLVFEALLPLELVQPGGCPVSTGQIGAPGYSLAAIHYALSDLLGLELAGRLAPDDLRRAFSADFFRALVGNPVGTRSRGPVAACPHHLERRRPDARERFPTTRYGITTL